MLFVGDARSGTRAAITQSTSQLRQVGARILGGVLNSVEPQKRSRGEYGPYDYRHGLLYRILVPDHTPNGDAASSRGRYAEPAEVDGTRGPH